MCTHIRTEEGESAAQLALGGELTANEGGIKLFHQNRARGGDSLQRELDNSAVCLIYVFFPSSFFLQAHAKCKKKKKKKKKFDLCLNKERERESERERERMNDYKYPIITSPS